MRTFEKRILFVAAVFMAIGVYYGISMVRVHTANLEIPPNFSAPKQGGEAETIEELEQELKFLRELLASIDEMTEEEKSEVSSEHLKFGIEMEIASLQARLERMKSGVAPQKTTPKKKGGMAI